MTTVHQDVLARIRTEYLDMPGLKLTAMQVQRLCGVEAPESMAALDALVRDNFLCLKPNGIYARAVGEVTTRPRPAKADLAPRMLAAAKR